MFDSIEETTELNNGVKMPWLGLGVYQAGEGPEVEAAVKYAFSLGYRSIDTAHIYGNERGVGRAVKTSGLARADVFITTKVWNDHQRQERTLAAFQESLDALGTDYVDLYLVHWPVRGHYLETWKSMEEIYESGRAKAIGVSNFLIHHLEEVMNASNIVPAVNQVEFHPYLVQPDLLAFCDKHNIRVEAWSPIVRGKILNDPTVTKLAEKHSKTAAQIVLRWDLQKGVVTIPKSVTPSRIKENAQIFDFHLSDEDMRELDALDRNARNGPDPDTFAF